MKKATFIKSVHKVLRDAGVKRGTNDWSSDLRYETYQGWDKKGMVVEVVSARNSSIQKRENQVETVGNFLLSAGIKCQKPYHGIGFYIDFKDNGVED